MEDAGKILPKAEKHRTEWEEYVRDVADIFHEEEGEMFTRAEALSLVTDSLGINESTAGRTISALVGDIVDPIVQVPIDGEKYIGVVEYDEYDGAYGYVHYDDVNGQQKRVVCAQCVKEKEIDKNVVNATAGHGSLDEDTDFDELLDAVHKHYESDHEEAPEDVETGASLLSGTTIAGNTAFHSGNDGTGSGLDADTVGGLQPGEVEHYSTKSNISVEAGQFAVADDTGSLYFEDGN